MHTRERGTDMATVAEYPHLRFSDLKHYHKALAVANSLGEETLKSFQESFAYLERICERGNATGEVYPDCDEDSFYFRVYRANNTLDLDGGIIKHGAGKTHSIELCPKSGVYWSMHT